ncbi:patatin-like phospholipase family protein [Bacillus altitudinis]|uniref:patatin-like phospholipase family protein n=1 Tax=Bacillus altitudinis TaxID=293387 RepID=UPI0002BDFAFD|nr:patatin [Bacillus stratosphericus LAMA 585]
MFVDGVFEGGGVRGIAHIGGVQAIEENGYQWNRLAGTSAGSIIAALLASGYSSSEIKEVMESLDYKRFMKGSWIDKVPLIGKGLNLFLNEGLYDNSYEEEWLDDLLKQKGIRNFDDIEEGKLKIIISDISNGRMVTIPDDLVRYGESNKFSIAKAVRMSSTIPFFFRPVKWKVKNQKTFYYIVDGGILSNFPIWIFDSKKSPKWPTFGFRLIKEEITPIPIKNFGLIGMYKSIFKTMMQAHDLYYLDKETEVRTIKIPTGTITSTDFYLNEEEKAWLFQSGYKAATDFLKTWDFESYIENFRSEP